MDAGAEEEADAGRNHILNVNVGVLGHVDSGKTSLVKALSTSLSTAALDKSSQSQQRGITLDLGFSAFSLPIPDHLQEEAADRYSVMQFTLVDCPGHASLIKTIIGGAQIIDMIVLVIDVNKGIQTQTAECIVIGEITTDNFVVVLNKIDSIPEEERAVKLEKVTSRIRKTLASTKFKDAPIVCTAAAVGGERVAAITNKGKDGKADKAGAKDKNRPQASNQNEKGQHKHKDDKTIGVDGLITLLRNSVQFPRRDATAPLYFAIDHCFPIKGHGTVLTGTVLSGSVSVNSVIEIPYIQQQRKVKSMQMFRKPVKSAQQGDRLGLCVTNLDAALIERGIAAAPGSVPLLQNVLCMVRKVRFFKGVCKSEAKYHVSIGHTTIVATATFFGATELAEKLSNQDGNDGDLKSCGKQKTGKAMAADKDKEKKGRKEQCKSLIAGSSFPSLAYDREAEFLQQDTLVGAETDIGGAAVDSASVNYGEEVVQWALLRFQQPVYCPLGSLVIGSRLDGDSGKDKDTGAGMCRLAFYGPIVQPLDLPMDRDQEREALSREVRLFQPKSKQAEVCKLTDVRAGKCHELIAWKLYGEGGSLVPFQGMRLKTVRGQVGVIAGAFGAGGKFKVKFNPPVPQSSLAPGAPLLLPFKRFLYDKAKVMHQTGLDLEETLVPISEVAKEMERLAVERLALAGPAGPEELLSLEQDGSKRGKGDKSDTSRKKGSNSKKKGSVPTEETRNGESKVLNDGTLSSGSSLPPPPPTQVTRSGVIDSAKEDGEGGCTVVVSGAFKMEENIRAVAGGLALGPAGEAGVLVGPFAKMGKCKVHFKNVVVKAANGKVAITVEADKLRTVS